MDLAILGRNYRVINELAAGNPTLAVEVLESGDPEELKNFADGLAKKPEARERMVRALRGEKVRKRGERTHNNHDDKIFPLVAYWIGRGRDDKWQDSKSEWDGETVWHLALKNCPESYGQPSSLRKRWQKYLKCQASPPWKGSITTVGCSMVELFFWCGVRDEVTNMENGEHDFIRRQLEKASKLGFSPIADVREILGIESHSPLFAYANPPLTGAAAALGKLPT